MGGALVFEVRSADSRRTILMVKLMGPTAQVIAGGVKPNWGNHYLLQNLNLNLNPEP